MSEIGIVPCARVANPEHAQFAAETLAWIASRFPDFIVGAGTVLDEQAARRSIDAGARFITSPGFVPESAARPKPSSNWRTASAPW